MALATIDDLIRQNEKARAITRGLEQANKEDLARLEWLAGQFSEIGELLALVDQKAHAVKQKVK